MLPCADGWFAEMVWEQNPLLYQLVFLGSLLDLLSLPLFAWRYKRLTLTLHLPLTLPLTLTPTLPLKVQAAAEAAAPGGRPEGCEGGEPQGAEQRAGHRAEPDEVRAVRQARPTRRRRGVTR